MPVLSAEADWVGDPWHVTAEADTSAAGRR
jgi:hypothetical protein